MTDQDQDQKTQSHSEEIPSSSTPHPPSFEHAPEEPTSSLPLTSEPNVSDGLIEPPAPTTQELLRSKWTQFVESARNLSSDTLITKTQEALQKLGSLGSEGNQVVLLGKIITLVASTWFAAGGAAVLLEKYIPEVSESSNHRSSLGSGSQRSSENDFAIIWTRNLISSKGLLPGEEGNEIPVDNGGAPVKSSLPLSLVGTLVLRDELRSIATIEDKSASMVYPLRVEDEIPGKIRVIGVEARRVVFLNLSASRREFLELPPDSTTQAKVSLGVKTGLKSDKGPGVEQLSATQFNVSRSEIDSALSDLNKVLTQARAVPNFENGQPNGYKLFQVVPGSIYDKLGLKNGDLLLGINGQPMSDPAKAFEMLSELKNQSHVELSVKRDGKASNFAYEIR